MDATTILTDQHREVDVLFDTCSKATETEALALAEELASALGIHTTIEEEIFYPACRDAGLGDLIDTAFEEHAQVKGLLLRLVEQVDAGPVFRDLLQEIRTAVLEHVEEEESNLFPRVREQIGAEELEELGNALEDRSEQLGESDAVERLADQEAARP